MSAMSAQARGARAAAARGPAAPAVAGVERSLALGWLAVLPLVAAYEAALALAPGSPRNTAEFALSLPLEVWTPWPAGARLAVELCLTVWAGIRVFHAELGLARRILRIALEGCVAAALLGPVLLVLLSLLEVRAPAIGRPDGVPAAAGVALVVGGAAFEEVVFRVGLQSALFVVAHRTLCWFLGLTRAARWIADAVSVAGGALFFAAAHLEPVVGLVADGGEPFDGARFAWRTVAGLVLALVFRWRGMGVAAWAHALFNLALALGAGPEVFL